MLRQALILIGDLRRPFDACLLVARAGDAAGDGYEIAIELCEKLRLREPKGPWLFTRQPVVRFERAREELFILRVDFRHQFGGRPLLLRMQVCDLLFVKTQPQFLRTADVAGVLRRALAAFDDITEARVDLQRLSALAIDESALD
jgi:hypothetical protein